MNSLFYFLIFFIFLSSCNDNHSIKTYRLAKGPDEKKADQIKSDLSWNKPSHWEEKPAYGMRKASFLVKGDERQAEVSIIFLPGKSGTLLANINRWRGQIGLDPILEEQVKEVTSVVKTSLGSIFVIDFSKEDGQKTMITAIVPQQKGRWYIKMMGDKDIVEKERKTFLKFIQSFH